MIRILFFLLTFLGSIALLLTSHLTGAGFVSSTVIVDQSWVQLLFTFGAFTTILSLFFVGFEMAAFVHRKTPVVVTTKVSAPNSNNTYPPVVMTPVTRGNIPASDSLLGSNTPPA